MVRILQAFLFFTVLSTAFAGIDSCAFAGARDSENHDDTGRLYERRSVGRMEYEEMQRFLYHMDKPLYYREPYCPYPYRYYRQRFYFGHAYYGYRYPYGFKDPLAYNYAYGYRWPYYSDPYDYFAVPDYIYPQRYYYPRSFYRDCFREREWRDD